METIKNYLDTMFLGLPMTEEVKRAKEELYSMMEDKYNELKAEGKTENEAVGTVISEFGNLEELAESLGIESKLYDGETNDYPKVSFEQAMDFVEKSIKTSKLTAIGVFLCICSPVAFMVLGGLFEGKSTNEDVMTLIGLVILFVFIAAAIVLFIVADHLEEDYKYLKKKPFIIDYETLRNVEEQKEQFKLIALSMDIVGIVCCFLSLVTFFIVGFLFEGIEPLQVIAAALLLIFIAVGVLLFILAGERMEAYSILLQEKEFSKNKKEKNISNVISTAYWSIIACIYLGWSLLTNDWHISWIIWVIAGILYNVVENICKYREEKNRKTMRML